MPADSPWIIETTDANFDQEVVERSHQVPVVVDFWAEWCAPCRLLAPLLETLAIEADGKFLLAKANVEQMPLVAPRFRVESIPAVFGLRGGRVVDQFLGVLPEESLRRWLDRLQPSPTEVLLAEAEKLKQLDPAAAQARLQEAVKLSPNDPAPAIGLAELLLAQDRAEEAEQALDALVQRGFLEPETQKLHARVRIRRDAGQVGTVDECRRALAESPADPGRQSGLAAHLTADLAAALAGAGDYSEALELLLGLVTLGKNERRDVARERMIRIFDVLGSESELATTYRRQLSSALS